MMVIGLVVGLPAFFEVGFVLLIPIAFTVARRTRTSLHPGRPAHGRGALGRARPRPAASRGVARGHHLQGRRGPHHPLRAAHRDSNGHPCRPASTPSSSRRTCISPHDNPMAAEFVDHDEERSLPGFGLTLFTILLPVLLMLFGSWADAFAAPGTALNQALHLIGNDDMALLIGVLLSFFTLGQSARLLPRDHPSLLQRVPCAHRDHHAARRRGRRFRPRSAGQRRLPGHRRRRAAHAMCRCFCSHGCWLR